jgi:uncharacterized protein YutE (UPF0331/DUF86 family)
MVNRNVLLGKIEYINGHLARVQQYRKLRFEHFIDDRNIQDIIEYNLFQAVNHLIAMMEHIVVDENYGLPQSAADAAVILKTKKVLTLKDVELIRKMIGFRNVVGHDYIHLDKKIVYGIMTKGIKDIQRIVVKLAKRYKI